MKQLTTKITGKFTWDCWYDEESGTWIATCDELKLTTFADRYVDVKGELEGVLEALLEEIGIPLSVEISHVEKKDS